MNSKGRAVVYWMQRAQRARDNDALNLAVEVANDLKLPLAVFFGLTPSYPNANERHYAFMLEGLKQTARAVEKRGAGFFFRAFPRNKLADFCEELKAALVIGDENPLREPESWRKNAAERLRVPFVTVDADNIVPLWLLPSEEYSARTIRPKLHREWEKFIGPGAEPAAAFRFRAGERPQTEAIEPARLLREAPLDRSARPVSSTRAGTEAAERELSDFVERRLALYPERRNHPEFANGTSRLSAYLHFGQIGPRQVAIAVLESDAPQHAKDAFLEQLIIRRELAANFVARNPQYDSYAGLPVWGRKTLEAHLGDQRAYLYSEDALERGETHDPLWNAAQKEMVATGFMHGYLRMYWAKKILEWTEHPAQAMEFAIRLNDRYLLDGRDPNGYAGIAWAMGGKHDRPWPPRPIFGTVRYMSFTSTSRKFDSRAYIKRVEKLTGNPVTDGMQTARFR